MAIQERPAFKIGGVSMLLINLALTGLNIALFVLGIVWGTEEQPMWLFFVSLVMSPFVVLLWTGLIAVQPNEGRALVFFGNYTGTVREPGFWWVNPLASKRRVSLRIRNFNSEKLKVNDAQGNPIMIAVVVSWKVLDTARALFDVDRYEEYVSIQSETAIRTIASHHPYDVHNDDQISLQGSPDEISANLKEELDSRLRFAGVEILDARISHLAYAPEIAQAMLRRQQASAIISARKLIVEGAVGMVEMALRRLAENHVIELDEERKAAMVSNLLVVLVSENETQPVINAGTLY